MRMNTAEYEFSHGHKPRGNGYWGFELTFTDGNGRYSTETAWAHGTPSQARAAAWQQVRRTVGGAKTLVECKVLP